MDPLAPVGLDEQLAALADPKRLMILRLLMAHPSLQVDLGIAVGALPGYDASDTGCERVATLWGSQAAAPDSPAR